jgi:hypothetical protein
MKHKHGYKSRKKVKKIRAVSTTEAGMTSKMYAENMIKLQAIYDEKTKRILEAMENPEGIRIDTRIYGQPITSVVKKYYNWLFTLRKLYIEKGILDKDGETWLR